MSALTPRQMSLERTSRILRRASSRLTMTTTIGDFSKCALCLDDFKDPRLLSCFHSFCLDCLETYIKKRGSMYTFPCPLCRKRIGIPKSGVRGFQVNFYVKNEPEGDYPETPRVDCDVCKDGKTASYNCDDCSENYCGPCADYHKKIKATKDHTLTNISSGFLSDTSSAIAVSGLVGRTCCEKHQTEEVSFYCRRCNILMCRECKVQEHDNHRPKLITEMASEKRGMLTSVLDKTREYPTYVKDCMDEVKTYQQKLDSEVQEAIDKIQEQADMVKEEADKYAEKLVARVKSIRDQESRRIEARKKDLEEKHTQISNVVESVDQIVTRGGDVELIGISQSLQKRLSRLQRELPTGWWDRVEVNFSRGEITKDRMENLIGHPSGQVIELRSVTPEPLFVRTGSFLKPKRSSSVMSINELYYEHKVKLVAAFHCPNVSGSTVHAIAPLTEKEGWVCCGWGSKQIHLLTIHGHKKKTISLYNQVDDFCKYRHDGLLVTSFMGKAIMRLKPDSRVVNFSILPHHPCGIVLNSTDEVIVCAVDNYSASRGLKSRRMLMRISENGKVRREIELDGPNQLFGNPYRVAINVDGSIVVSDWEVGNGRVVILGPDGALRQTYYGGPRKYLRKPFDPRGICCDNEGHILVSDGRNNVVHMLDRYGDFIQILLTDKHGIQNPDALALDVAGNLWVGDNTSFVRIFKYVK